MLSNKVFLGAFLGKTVVILEQEGMTQLYLRKMLLRAGFQVLGQSQTWQAGLLLVIQTRPDVVLFDISLAEHHDLPACVSLFQGHAGCVILLSPFSEAVSQKLTEWCGAQGYLTKPLEGATCLLHLQQYCPHLRPT